MVSDEEVDPLWSVAGVGFPHEIPLDLHCGRAPHRTEDRDSHDTDEGVQEYGERAIWESDAEPSALQSRDLTRCPLRTKATDRHAMNALHALTVLIILSIASKSAAWRLYALKWSG